MITFQHSDVQSYKCPFYAWYVELEILIYKKYFVPYLLF